MALSPAAYDAEHRHAERPVPRRRARLAALTVLAMVASMLAVVTAASPAVADTSPTRPGEPVTVTADRLPTVQINGVVWDQVIVGNRVYATGQFTQARPAGAAAGQNQTARSNILAYDLTTGNLITSWAPTLNAQGMVITASADGSRIYVGGDFTQVSGVSRTRIVALNAQTGAVITGFNASANNRVQSLAVNGNTLYVGGHFTTAGGQARSRLAAVNATTGALLAWAPSADRDVIAMTVHAASGRVIVGGSFTTLNGLQQRGMTSLDGTTGALMPWAANQVIQNYGPNTEISSLTTDGSFIYGMGWAYFGAGGTTANFEGQFQADPLTGEIKWINGCRGDQYAITLQADVLYTAGHAHDCGMIDYNPEVNPRVEHRAFAFDKRGSSSGRYNAFGPIAEWQPFAGRPATDPLHWIPEFSAGSYTGSFQAGYSVEATSDYVVYGGEFPRVNGVNQQGLVRFGKRAVPGNPNAQGPLGVVAPTATVVAPGVVRVGWAAPYDRDNSRLRYQVLRGTTVLTEFEIDSTYWKRIPLGFLDRTAPAGNQSYRIRVVDAFNTGGNSPATTVNVPSGARPESVYADSVRANGAIHHWRLDEATGTGALDLARSNDGTLLVDAQRGVAGALLNETNASTTFPASTSTNIVRGTTGWFQAAPQTFSVEAWFQTTSTQGGKIVGFGSSNTGRSNSNATDRHIYMTNSGELRFGLRPDMGTRLTINSPAGYNDGQWHHVVGTLGGNGAQLLVDGQLVAQDAAITKGQQYYGYWRIGGDRLSSWPSAPTREAFEGTIDEVAVYPTALSATQAQANYAASGRTGAPNQRPTAVFTVTPNELNPTFDGSGSTDPDGTVASHSWNFGDGTAAGTGATTSHPYAGAGTYNVTLTVTDDDGAIHRVTQPVTVAGTPPPNQQPVAEFTSTVDGLKVDVNGSTSTDPEGPISSYSWDFNNGAGSATGVTATHTFAAAGTYPVKLTVTDAGGLTSTITKDVTVTAPPPNQQPVAEFTSTVDGLKVDVNGSTSTDPEGPISSYSWDFNNGAGSATGVTATHTFAAAGTYPVKLTVTDAGGLTSTITKDVTVTAPPPNQQPVAEFTSTVDGLKVDVNGSTSTDPEGPISGYSWDFNNGAGSATGVTATHTFAAAGTFPVKLTVTDAGGLTSTITKDVTVTAPPNPGPQPFAADTFARAASNGLGTAETGGAWTLSGTASSFSVSNDAGRILGAPGLNRAAYLTGATSLDFNQAVDVSVSAAASGSGAYVYLIGRRVSNGNDYRVQVRYQSNGSVVADLVRTVGGTATTLGSVTVPGLTVSPNDVLRVRFQGIGAGTTALAAKVWHASQAEPSAWSVTANSTSPAVLQSPGHVGILVYLSSAWVGAGATVTIDNLRAIDPE